MTEKLNPQIGDHEYFVKDKEDKFVDYVNGFDDEDALAKAKQEHGEDVTVDWRKYVG